MKPIMFAWVAIATGILATGTVARAPLLELDSCHDGLDRVRRAASDASDAAEDAQSKRGDFENCSRDSEFYGGCGSRRADYESALSDLEGKMDDLDSRLRSVQSSCDYEFTINRMSAVEAARSRLCTSLKRLVSLGAPPDKVLQTCKGNTDEQWCKACLGLR